VEVMSEIYNLFLEEKLIGTTRFESADAPMGIVFGKIHFIDIPSPYAFIKSFCDKNQITYDEIINNGIMTRTIHKLKIVNEKEIEIKGLGNQISGMDSDGFEITLEGVSYPFYQIEFAQHVKNYEEKFK
jgi:hypothetical protein